MALARTSLREYLVTLAILLAIFAMALFIRSYFAFDIAVGQGNLVSGGSDSYYNERIINYTLNTGQYLYHDRLLDYPLGYPNPRSPVYTWSTILTGYLLAPFMHFDTLSAVWLAFEFSTAIWGALTIFPTYFLAKETFGKRTGYLAALFLAIMPAHIEGTALSDARHRSMALFFVVLAFYFFLRGLRTLNERAYITHWRTFITDPRTFTAELATFLRENRAPILYALLAGFSLLGIALTWQGWPYALVIMLAYLLLQLLVQRFRNQDPMGPVVVFGVAGGAALLLAAPYYVGLGFYRGWYDTPLFLYLGTLLIGIIFTVTRRYPWVLVVPTLILAFAAAVLIAGQLYFGSATDALLSGFGFFPKNKIYETIAEAQPPGVSTAIISFGAVTYYLSLAGVAWMMIQFPKRPVPDYLFVVVWLAASIFMAMTQARFLFNAAPAFAVPAAWITVLIVERLGFGKIGEAMRGSQGRLRALRRGLKVRHVVGALFIAFLLILPNTWLAVDAAVPIEKKAALDKQVANALPAPLRPSGYQSGQLFYFGAFAFSLPLPTQYFPQAWQWLRSQDANVQPMEARPAYISWWDYGFEVVDKGEHPTVADNFQNGIPTAGNFIAAQDETTAIAILALRVVDGDYAVKNQGRGFSPQVTSALASAGLDPSEFLAVYRNPSAKISAILNDPARFGPYDSNIAPGNAQIIYLSTVMKEKLSTNAVADLYGRLMDITGYQIRYFSVDSRLIPFSATNTGIFYAPIKLSDHRIVGAANGQVIPIDFFRLSATLTTGATKDLTQIKPGDQVSSVNIQYQDMFYRSMLYRTFFGITPSEAGATGNGLPGLPGNLQGVQPQQGWMLSHFKLVYKTAYYNPYPPGQVQNHSDAWRALDYKDAVALQRNITAGKANGTVDLSAASGLSNGIVFVKYYEGAVLGGRVTTADGTPVVGARVTVQDEQGIPHDANTTGTDGGYQVLLPFGTPKVTVSTGAINNATQVGSSTLAETSFSVSDAQAMRRSDNSSFVHNFVIQGQGLSGRVFLDLNNNGRLDAGETNLAGASVTVRGALNTSATTTANGQGAFAFRSLLPGLYSVAIKYQGRNLTHAAVSIQPNQAGTQDLNIPGAGVKGRVTFDYGTPALGLTVSLADILGGRTLAATTDSSGGYTFSGLLPGPYVLSASSQGFTSDDQKVTVGQGVTTSQDLTLLVRGTITGRATSGGAALPGASITFRSRPPDTFQTVVQADASGSYSITLPKGTYDVYALTYHDGRPHAFLGSVTVGPGTTTLDVPMVPAVALSGLAYEGNASTPAGGMRVNLLGGSGRYVLTTADNGTFFALLPPDQYTALGQKDRWMVLDTFQVAGTVKHNLPLQFGTLVTGVIYRDMNGNRRPDAGEGLPAVEVTVFTDKGATYPAYTDSSGNLPLVALNGTLYGLRINVPGFAAATVNPLDATALVSASKVALVADKVRVTGSVTMEGSAPGISITLKFGGAGRGATNATASTDANGAYSVDLDPGIYGIAADQPLAPDNSSRAQAQPGLQTALRIGQGSASSSFDLVRRWRVLGTATLNGQPGAAALTFRGPERATAQADTRGNYSLYLRPGNYTVSASAKDAQGKDYAFLGPLTINGAVTFGRNLDPAVRVSGGVLAGGKNLPSGVPLNFTRSGGGGASTNSTGTGYSLLLPPGDYTISVDYRTTDTLDVHTRYVHYAAQVALTVPVGTSQTFALNVSRTLNNRTLQGTVLSVPRGSAPTGASLTFRATADSAIDASTSTPSGGYTIDLAPGSYDLYAVANDRSAVFLGSVLLDPAGTNRVDVFLNGGHFLRGTATYGAGIGTQAKLILGGNSTTVVPTALDGSFNALLPPGTYVVTAEAQVQDRGSPVLYRGQVNVILTSDTTLNIPMARQTIHAVALTWLGTKPTLQPGGSFTTRVTVVNRGSVQDTFNLKGAPANWNFTFDRASVTLDFAGVNDTTVTVTIQAPLDATVEHPQVQIGAASQADATATGTANVDVGIVQSRGVAIAPSALTASLNATLSEFPVEVRNTGNGLDRFTVRLVNGDELLAAGWNATLADASQGITAQTIHNISVAARASTNITLRLVATGAPRPVTAIVAAAPEGIQGQEQQTNIAVQFPRITSPGPQVTGPGISTSPEFPWTFVSLIASGGVVAVGITLILLRRLRSPRGRRRR